MLKIKLHKTYPIMETLTFDVIATIKKQDKYFNSCYE